MPVDNNTPAEFFAQLHESLREDAPDASAMQRSLEEQGIEVEAVVSEGLRLFAEFKKRTRLKRARNKLDRIREAVGAWRGKTDHSFCTIRESIAHALAGEGGEVSFQTYHRKLASVDESDLESLLEDAALLEFITRIEADEEE